MPDFIARRDVLTGVATISAWHGLCLPALAAKSEAQKLKMSVENSFVKVSMAVDEALTPFPELMTNCLSEGKAWVAKNVGDATTQWHENPKAFSALLWSYNRDYVLRSVVGRYISIVRSDDWFDCGAQYRRRARRCLAASGQKTMRTRGAPRHRRRAAGEKGVGELADRRGQQGRRRQYSARRAHCRDLTENKKRSWLSGARFCDYAVSRSSSLASSRSAAIQ